jgi:deazaflavin-dependent oxidoreductase (nitroreductase family)
MQTNALPDTGSRESSSPQDPPTAVATRSKILRWESVAWVVVGSVWIVSAWPGLLVEWDGVPMAVLTGLGVLAGFVAWHVIVHGARLSRPGTWVGYRWRTGRPGQRMKSRKHLAATVVADAVGWSLSAIGWCVAAAVFDWSETLTGAALQLAFGVAFIGWGLLHIPAARLLAAPDADLVVLSRRVLGSGPPTVDIRRDETGHLAAATNRSKSRRGRLLRRLVLNPAARALTHLGLLRHYAVLETVGRRSGRARRTVVGIARQPESVLWIVAEHGRQASYVRNLDADPNVRIRVGRRWQRGWATVVADDDVDARLRLFTPQHVKAIRHFGTELASVRIDLTPESQRRETDRVIAAAEWAE